MNVSQPGSRVSRLARERIGLRRPRLLLLAELFLLGLFLLGLRWLVGALFEPGFLSDRASAPPAIVDAHLDRFRATVALVLPLLLVAVTLYRLRFPARATWPWTPIIVAWLVLAFAETVIASPDLTAAVLALGLVPMLLINHHQPYLRRAAGQAPEDRPWSPLRRWLTALTALAVVAWSAVYLILGAIGASSQFFHLPPGLYGGWP